MSVYWFKTFCASTFISAVVYGFAVINYRTRIKKEPIERDEDDMNLGL